MMSDTHFNASNEATDSMDSSTASLPSIQRPLNVVQWHVMRVSYHREQKAFDYLSALGIQCYLPKKTEVSYDGNGDRIVKIQDVLPNFIFVKISRKNLYELKAQMPSDIPLQYFLDRTLPGHPPMTIPAKMMDDFIRQTTERPESLLWLNSPADVFVRGKKVRVIYGPLTGCEGYILRIKRNQRFVLSLNGLVSAAVMSTDCRYDWIEPID